MDIFKRVHNNIPKDSDGHKPNNGNVRYFNYLCPNPLIAWDEYNHEIDIIMRSITESKLFYMYIIVFCVLNLCLLPVPEIINLYWFS